MTAIALSVIAFVAPPPPDQHYEPTCVGPCQIRVQQRMIREHRRETVRPYSPWLQRLRGCESTGNYRVIDASGTYTGAYQFDDETWHSVGGTGRAMHAAPLEQDYRAVRLRKRRGTRPWPRCG